MTGWKVYDPNTDRVLCPICDRWLVPTTVGQVRVHGPRNDRCAGSGLGPDLPVQYVEMTMDTGPDDA